MRTWLLMCVGIVLSFAEHANAQLTATFTANVTDGCSPFAVDFTDLSSGGGNIIMRNWVFGNGNFANGNSQNVSAIYGAPGTYDVSLTVSDGIDTVTVTYVDFITVFHDPLADFTAANIQDCAVLTTDFQDASTPGDAPISQWQWAYGDGSPNGTTQNPSHDYLFPGVYTVSLIVTDTNGCTDFTDSVNLITVNPHPTPDFSASPTGACLPPLTVNFQNLSTGTGTLNYEWLFGDGGSAITTNPTHTYTAAGSFDVMLVAADLWGCADTIVYPGLINIINPTADFTWSGNDTVCEGQGLNFTSASIGGSSYEWDFGTAGTSNSQNPLSIVLGPPGSYDVMHIAINGNCADTIIKTIVVEEVVADFTASPVFGCEVPLTISYQDQSSPNVVSWYWGHGYPINGVNGNFPYAQAGPSPSGVCMSLGSFPDTLIVTTIHGCSDTMVIPNHILTYEPSPDFWMDINQGCIPLQITFTDSTSPMDSIISWHWDFGDGDTSNLQNPVHTYTTDGTFSVALTVTTVSGCSHTTYHTVFAGVAPDAAFSVDTIIGCAQEEITFTDQSTGYPIVNQHYWYFSDMSSSSASTFLHTFQDTGWMDLTYIAGYNGCFDTITASNVVYVLGPVVDWQIVVDCDNPYDRLFNTSLIDADRWYWDFGDNSPIDSVSTNPIHTYPDNIWYQTSIVAYNDNTGCDYHLQVPIGIKDPIAHFYISDSVACSDLFVQFDAINSQDVDDWEWNLDNGAGYEFYNYWHPYESEMYVIPNVYWPELVVHDLYGCTDTFSLPVKVLQPIADFEALPPTGCPVFTTQLNDLTYTDTTLAIWSWNLGNGTTSNVQNPVATYISTGVYDVSLYIEDIFGCNDSITKSAYITVTKPPAFFTAPTQGCADDSVQFLGAPPGFDYLWDFGDGTTSTLLEPSHAYSDSGLYTITLTVTDTNGCDSTYALIDHLDIQKIPPMGFHANPLDSTCYPVPVTFWDTTNYAHVSTYTWSFGGSYPVLTAANPIAYNTYTLPGSFDVSLLITTTYGCQDSVTFPQYINISGPVASFTVSDDTICIGDEVQFEITDSGNILEFTWDFGDGIDSTVGGNVDSMSHVYWQTGALQPRLIYVDSGQLCPRYYEGYIYVDQVVTDFAILPDTFGCVPLTVTMSDSTFSATSYLWNSGNGVFDSVVNPTFTYTQPGTYDITLFAWDDTTGCNDLITHQVLVHPLPPVPINADTLICVGDSIQLFTNEMVDVVWSPPHGLSDIYSNHPLAAPDSSLMYTVVATDHNGCVDSNSVHIDVQQIPQFGIMGDTTIFHGQSIDIWSWANEDLIYSWSPPLQLTCTECPTPNAYPYNDVTYTLTVTDLNNCFTQDTSVTISVDHQYNVYVPNTFTPDGDGINDTFGPQGFGIKEWKSFMIFDRWGNIVFEATEQQPDWDGTMKGMKCQQDVYVWRLIAVVEDGEELEFKGHVTLLR